MATTETEPLRTYRGNCHCGAFVYEVELPEIKSVFQCNCSICHKKAYLWVFPGEADNFRVVKGTDDTLTGYRFGPKKLVHKFCPTCATPVMGQFPGGPPGKQRALNVRAMQGVNTWDLEKMPFDGAALGDKYVPPEYKGTLPTAFEGSKLYTGSCHCGAVSVALASKPLDETFDEQTVECNCSICERNGYCWVIPEHTRVVLSGDDAHVGRYSFARRLLSKTFCRTCGVCLTNEYRPVSEEQRAALSGQDRALEALARGHHPVNLRVLEGVDLGGMKPPRRDNGATGLPTPYVNP
ncbi:Centromere protein V [Tolypocladium paradoxum]|uniref:Centromere protein V n=1 Tax=Tolypocladium paradoxum TaxID=94208 RepID=A0A2S4KLR8_9HYPO|nr:Centromere protein V [Tolypocladium paradoxum]